MRKLERDFAAQKHSSLETPGILFQLVAREEKKGYTSYKWSLPPRDFFSSIVAFFLIDSANGKVEDCPTGRPLRNRSAVCNQKRLSFLSSHHYRHLSSLSSQKKMHFPFSHSFFSSPIYRGKKRERERKRIIISASPIFRWWKYAKMDIMSIIANKMQGPFLACQKNWTRQIAPGPPHPIHPSSPRINMYIGERIESRVAFFSSRGASHRFDFEKTPISVPQTIICHLALFSLVL